MSGNKIALVIGLICALIASLMVSKVINQNAKNKMATIAKVQVVFAKNEIPSRTIIAAEQLELRSIPKEAVSPNSARKITDVVGKVTKSELLAGEQVNLNRLLRQGDNVNLSFLIPNGLRALTIAVDEVIGVAGFVKPGERVDVIGTMEPKDSKTGSVTWTVLQDVEVLAVSQEMNAPVKESKKDPKNEPKLGTSVTLAVTPFQAQKVALAEEKGVLRLTLRPALKEPNITVAPVRESSLIPSSSGSGGFKAPVSVIIPIPKPKRQIEVISGGKIETVTVD